jgi:hypothetical protein
VPLDRGGWTNLNIINEELGYAPKITKLKVKMLKEINTQLFSDAFFFFLNFFSFRFFWSIGIISYPYKMVTY